MGNTYKRILDCLDRIKGDTVTWEQINEQAKRRLKWHADRTIAEKQKSSSREPRAERE